MAARVIVQDAVVKTYDDFKLKHESGFIQFKLKDDWTEIQVEKAVESSTFSAFVEQLPKNDCRFAVFDFLVDLDDSEKTDKFVFIAWYPKEAFVKTKMIYLSIKDTLRKKLAQLALDVQATARSDLSEQAILDKLKTG